MKNKCLKLTITMLISIFILLMIGYDEIFQSFDLKIINIIQGLENNELTLFYEVITDVADTYQSMFITIVLVTLLYIKKYKREAIFLAISMSICGIVVPLLKRFVSRNRPEIHRLIEIEGLSFPSGHSTSATIMYLTLAIISRSIIKGINKNLVITLASVGIIIIASSRIYLGVHYPTDVLAGMCLGASIVGLVYLLYYKTMGGNKV